MNEFDLVDEWLTTLRGHLDLDGLETPDWVALLDTVRATAHGVVHAAGPVTALAVGYAVARGGGSAEALAEALGAVRALLADRTTR